ncbi:DUF1343 domain-containing protein [Latilactobacillus curvatus]|uniref:DUF1343 domain-containing protein n=1 Tax=Latilactobacillus curvatus TaxID=28038 RepID=A0A385AGA7_LATCU|nr:DUF1343 domain-containing protein [Latilactobacillus curvatus]AXN36644.1 DUF1343 domain-containing protein [Latilactobacillus curvatus]
MVKTKLGIERVELYKELIFGKNVGLITNYTGVTSSFEENYKVFSDYCNIRKIFSPEHGLHGVAEAGENVESYYDNVLKIDVVSLYGTHNSPTVLELKGIDILIFDIQDIGIRYYTYIYTMLESMRVAETVGIPFIVMDRPLPLGRQEPIGEVLTNEYFSFVGMLELPNSYGLTIGELANWIQKKQLTRLKLRVIPLENWDNNLNILENELPWVSPSPNLPSLDSVRLYTGLCLIEGTNVSEGRGTVYPFQQIGAPWIDCHQLMERLRGKISGDGIMIQPVWFIPNTSKYAGEVCQGVRFHITDREVNSLYLGYILLDALRSLYPKDFKCDLVSTNIGVEHKFIEYLAGIKIDKYTDFELLANKITKANTMFKEEVKKYFLY